jgi:hypothetical protein
MFPWYLSSMIPIIKLSLHSFGSDSRNKAYTYISVVLYPLPLNTLSLVILIMLKSFILSSSHNFHSISTPINYAINYPLYSSFIILSAYIIRYLMSCYSYESQLRHIPKVGYSSPLRRPIDTFNSIL